MRRGKPRRLSACTIVSLFLIVAVVRSAGLAFATSANTVTRAAHSCVVLTGSSDTTFTRNFNPFGVHADLTLGGVYEPLYIYTSAGGGHTYPWLATKYRWSKDTKTLFITIRHGVKWSDGKPFTAKDVLFTFNAGKINKAMDQIQLTAPDSNIARIYLASSDTVAVRLKKRDITWTDNLSSVKVIPEHIWSTIKKPTDFTNPNPVGTGPFTRVVKFSGQDYVMGKNPHYWQKGKPMVSCVERTFAASNDAAELSMIRGDVDWTGNFVANIQKAYVAKDPAHYHYFYATNTPASGLFYDDTKYPWSLAGFRKAVSMAIDRNKMNRIAEYGTAPPSGPIGLEDQYPKWIDPKVEAAGKKYTTYNPGGARALLKKLHFTYKGSTLIDPHGNPVSMPMNVIAGWTDAVLDMQIIGQNLKAIGIDAPLKLSPDYTTWSPLMIHAQEVTLHWTNSGGQFPIAFFKANLSKASYVPLSQDPSTTGDYERFYDNQATPLVSAFYKTPSKAQQHAIINKLEALWVKDMPFVLTLVSPIYYTYSTKYFTGWPTPSHYYASGAPYNYPDVVKVLTSIKPIK